MRDGWANTSDIWMWMETLAASRCRQSSKRLAFWSAGGVSSKCHLALGAVSHSKATLIGKVTASNSNLISAKGHK